MKGRVAVPLHNLAGELVGYAGRWAGKDDEIPDGEGKWKLPAGFRKGLEVFNAHRVQEGTKHVILLEGGWSVFWLHQNGYPNVVSVLGSAVSKEQAGLLAARYGGVQILFDGDAAGREGARKAALELASRVWVRIVECPDGLQPDRLPSHELKKLLGS
jgi:DNA primase